MVIGLRPLFALCLAVALAAGCTASVSHGSGASSRPTAGGVRQPLQASGTQTRLPPSASAGSRTTGPAASGPKPIVALPLRFGTGSATRVVTVVARSVSNTVGTLQAWQRSGTGWLRQGPATTAYLGSAGLSAHPSESKAATPIGSFTMTRAFGRLPNPGTALPYRQTTPADWWISEDGPLYNTFQRCSAYCGFTQGPPNEHLYYAVPFYDYAVVIDYNTPNAASGVRAGAGSAFFVHVTVGKPTEGCVSIARERLVALLQWLSPRDHPRILIGVA